MKRYSAIPTDKRIKNESVPIVGILKSHLKNDYTCYVIRREDIDCPFALTTRTLDSIVSDDNTQYHWGHSHYVCLADVPLDTRCTIINAGFFDKELIIDE